MSAEPTIRVTHLAKRYWRTTAVDDVTFTVRRGEIFGLLGPNGAGKSTIIKILCNLASPTAGEAVINGFDCQRDALQARRSLGYVPEVVQTYGEMTGKQFLDYSASFYEMAAARRDARVTELLSQVGLTAAAERKTRTYSKGMRQRLALAAALVHQPDVLILDEPLSGLDPIGTRDLRRLIRRLRGETTILFSSHNLYEAEALCDRVAILNQGRIVKQGSLHDLLQSQALRVRLKLMHAPNGLARTLEAEGLATVIEARGTRLTVEVKEASLRPALLRRIMALGGDVYEMTTEAASLEEVFANLLAPQLPEEGARASPERSERNEG